MALNGHAERVSDQHNIHARFIFERSETRVVACQHDDRLALLMHLSERAEFNRLSGFVFFHEYILR